MNSTFEFGSELRGRGEPTQTDYVVGSILCGFGSELRGRGEPTHTDYVVGSILCGLSAVALLLGLSNLYLVRKMDTFHNAFGWFWASRTVGEVGFNIIHLLYSVPVTILQPTQLPAWMGIAAFDIGYFFAHHACAMHQVVSLNRCVAVCLPMKYQHIFTNKVCRFLIVFLWVQVFTLATLYHILPCSLVGYSPTLYEFVYVRCEENPEKSASLAATLVNRLCFTVCLGTVVSDLITIGRIAYIRLILKLKIQDKGMRRDIRFFAQSSVQNITMMIALTLVIIVNNSTDMKSPILFILSLDVLVMTHINNALALLLFNPEVRKYILCKMGFRDSKISYMSSSHVENAIRTRTMNTQISSIAQN
uniref:G_PROTEIN_RECEP_F1_2 domain-containing protein n=1 Tax=Steinernema glaseri TaxID=37863 RepID=A0A1I7XW18_9BILA